MSKSIEQRVTELEQLVAAHEEYLGPRRGPWPRSSAPTPSTTAAEDKAVAEAERRWQQAERRLRDHRRQLVVKAQREYGGPSWSTTVPYTGQGDTVAFTGDDEYRALEEQVERELVALNDLRARISAAAQARWLGGS